MIGARVNAMFNNKRAGQADSIPPRQLLPGAEIWNAATMADFLATKVQKFHLPNIWTSVKQATRLANDERKADDDLVYFIDTKYYSRKGTYPRLLELAIFSDKGECIFEATIDHEMTLSEMIAEVLNHIAKWSVTKVYGKDPTAEGNRFFRPPGIKMTDVADILADLGVSPAAVFVEWSTAWSDYYCMSNTLNAINRGNILPTKERWLRVPVVWRQNTMPGITTCALELLFPLVFPGHSGLGNHRAKVDAQKLFMMTEKMLAFVK